MQPLEFLLSYLFFVHRTKPDLLTDLYLHNNAEVVMSFISVFIINQVD